VLEHAREEILELGGAYGVQHLHNIYLCFLASMTGGCACHPAGDRALSHWFWSTF